MQTARHTLVSPCGLTRYRFTPTAHAVEVEIDDGVTGRRSNWLESRETARRRWARYLADGCRPE